MGPENCHLNARVYTAIKKSSLITSKNVLINVFPGDAVYGNLTRGGYNIAAITDNNASALSQFPDAPVVGTAREVAEVSDVIITSLPKPPNVRDAFEGKDGILAGNKKNGL